jgi:hypothetical protein
VYQNANCANLSSNVSNIQAISSNIANPFFNTSNVNLGFRLFKNSISIGPISEYTVNSGSEPTGVYQVPWMQIASDAASVSVNGNIITSDRWNILNNNLLISEVPPNSDIKITLTGPVSYYSIGANAVSELTSNLYSSDSSISVSNVAGLITPNVYTQDRGVLFVGNERITYLYIDRTNNILSGLMRGTLGTGVPNVHMANSQVISASYDRMLPGNPGETIWYSNSNVTLASDENSVIGVFLMEQGTFPPS